MRTLLLSLPLVLAVGCVSKSKYAELESQYTELQATSAGQAEKLEKLEADMARARSMAEAARQNFLEIKKEFQPLIDRGVLEITVDDGRIVIGMASDVLFSSGSAELSAGGLSNVTEVARLLARRSDRDFQVEGHTDDDPISSDEFPSNWHLGAARALTVAQVLVSNGLQGEQVSAATFGEFRPVASNGSASGKTQNRRIEIVLLPDLSELPGYEALMEHGRPARPARKGRKGKKGRR